MSILLIQSLTIAKIKGLYNVFDTLKAHMIICKLLRKGLDTVESLSAEASGNLSTNRNHLISTTVKWD